MCMVQIITEPVSTEMLKTKVLLTEIETWNKERLKMMEMDLVVAKDSVDIIIEEHDKEIFITTTLTEEEGVITEEEEGLEETPIEGVTHSGIDLLEVEEVIEETLAVTTME